MSIIRYRVIVVVCAATWLLVGSHLPTLHQMTHHGRAPYWPAIVATGLLIVLGCIGLLMLLRAPLATGGVDGSASG